MSHFDTAETAETAETAADRLNAVRARACRLVQDLPPMPLLCVNCMHYLHDAHPAKGQSPHQCTLAQLAHPVTGAAMACEDARAAKGPCGRLGRLFIERSSHAIDRA